MIEIFNTMIQFNNLSKEMPYQLLKKKYDEALNAGQKVIEAISISSFNNETNEVDSRYVNLKFITNNEFIFFSNYNSPKATAFKAHNQIAALFYWSSTNTQIRIKGKIKKTSKEFNQEYFFSRSKEKNALAISSKQSEKIGSYEEVYKNYEITQKKADLSICPDYWGGFSFIPYYFEFWEGHESRINKRLVFKKIDKEWDKVIIQP